MFCCTHSSVQRYNFFLTYARKKCGIWHLEGGKKRKTAFGAIFLGLEGHLSVFSWSSVGGVAYLWCENCHCQYFNIDFAIYHALIINCKSAAKTHKKAESCKYFYEIFQIF